MPFEPSQYIFHAAEAGGQMGMHPGQPVRDHAVYQSPPSLISGSPPCSDERVLPAARFHIVCLLAFRSLCQCDHERIAECESWKSSPEGIKQFAIEIVDT